MNNALTFCFALGGLAYAILPFGLTVWLLARWWGACDIGRYRNIFLSSVAGAACFCFVGVAVSAWNFDLLIAVHAAWLAASLAATVLLWRTIHASIQLRRLPFAMLLIVAIAGLVRATPFVLDGLSMGGDDARFHLILVEKILRERSLASNWLPFADANTFYPQGSHVLVAFVADVCRVPPHCAFNTALALFGAMTSGMIGVIAGSVFASRKSGLWAAAAYAFVALQGSLDYHRWGGMPNCMGMLFVLLAVYVVLFGAQLQASRALLPEFSTSLLLVATLLAHDYSWLAGMMWLALGAAVVPDSSIRRKASIAIAASLLVASPLLGMRFARMAETAGSSDLFRFKEPFITIFSAILNLNPLLAALAVIAIIGARRAKWTPASLFALAGMAAFMAGFVVLEYLYRGATLAFSRGRECFTALTPSRMIANASYPMCLIIGWIPLLAMDRPARRMLTLLAGAGAVITVVAVMFAQQHVGKNRNYLDAGLWLRDNTPDNAMIVGSFPFAEYLSWRETTHPPLPVSEPRRHPAVTWKLAFASSEEWLSWSHLTGRPVYFLAPPDRDLPPPLERVYFNDAVAIWQSGLRTMNEPAPGPQDAATSPDSDENPSRTAITPAADMNERRYDD